MPSDFDPALELAIIVRLATEAAARKVAARQEGELFKDLDHE